MKKIVNLILTLVIMALASAICLLLVSILSYIYKWQADKALIGITVTYILVGFVGGLFQKILNKEEKDMKRKMLNAMLLGTVFIGILSGLSVVGLQQPFLMSSRFLMIYMLLVGSTCLGRIL